MSRFFDIWEPVLNSLEERYPNIAKRIVDWYPVGRNEIMVKTDDGDRSIFNYIGASLRKLNFDNDTTGITEEQWRNEFSKRLCTKMSSSGMAQWQLARLTGISEMTISKYMNGRSTPSAYNIRKLAIALNCSVQELSDFVS